MISSLVRKIAFIIGLLPPLVSFGQALSPLPAQLSVTDHRIAKSYTVAADEIARMQTDGSFKVEKGDMAKAVKTKPNAYDTRIVLYPEGQPRTEGNRRLLTERILVQTRSGTDPAALAKRQGISQWKATAALENQFVLSANSAQSALKILDNLRADSSVVVADFLLARQQSRRGRPNDPLFRLQWHLFNTGQNGGLPGIDAGVVNVWGNFNGAGYRGKGVTIGIVDDGVQFTHPDLQPNYDTRLDYDWNDNTPYDPTPSERNEDYHGTSVAGVAAARGGNGIGVSGVAPQARLTGLRLIAAAEDDSDEAEAFLLNSQKIAIKNNSWGPDDDGRTMEAPGPIASEALVRATSFGRFGRGTIFVWAAGNGREEGDNSNYDGYANSIYTIAVTAINNRGGTTFYGEGGANVIVGAPSDNFSRIGITTTDLAGNDGYNYKGVGNDLSDTNYTQTFGGTSSATPVVSGVVALMLQRNPFLGWRDVQEILLRTAGKNDPKNPNWIINGAGFQFNKEYGAGLVNATRAVRFAGNWINLGPQTSQIASDATAETIPDGAGSLVRNFSFPTSQRVEHVTVKLNISHASRGQIRVTLTSPAGTVSELAAQHNDSNDDIDWTYMTVRNWGESSAGVWQLTVADTVSGIIGTYNSADVTVFGTAAAAL